MVKISPLLAENRDSSVQRLSFGLKKGALFHNSGLGLEIVHSDLIRINQYTLDFNVGQRRYLRYDKLYYDTLNLKDTIYVALVSTVDCIITCLF